MTYMQTFRLFFRDGGGGATVDLGVNEFSREAKNAKFFQDLQRMCLCVKAYGYFSHIIIYFFNITAETIIEILIVITMKFYAQVCIIKNN